MESNYSGDMQKLLCLIIQEKKKVNYKNEENEWKKDSTTKSSPLSLHINVYEKDFLNLNYGTKDDGLKRIKKEIVSRSVIQNPFEFSRQQNSNETKVPEVVQFRTSQQLYDPNQMDQWALNELPHYSDALYIIFLVFGIVFSIVGICGTIYSIKRTRSIGPKLEEQFKIVHDDQLNYPRCAVAAAEQNISVATPWKHYFTRDEQPFIKETALP
uniref:Uncharacterized protein n=1 Tax=Panagrolaimus sp. PS1159 TaxID=55785 RepID=A0AC35FUQ8_9BILA